MTVRHFSSIAVRRPVPVATRCTTLQPAVLRCNMLQHARITYLPAEPVATAPSHRTVSTIGVYLCAHTQPHTGKHARTLAHARRSARTCTLTSHTRTHTHEPTHTHARAHARICTRTHARAHAQVLTDQHCGTYYHFILETLPKLVMLLDVSACPVEYFEYPRSLSTHQPWSRPRLLAVPHQHAVLPRPQCVPAQ